MMQITLIVTTGPHAGREFTFDGHDNFIVGRSKAAQFRLSSKDQFFSRNHFLVEVNPPLCRLLDLNSTNGTHVNGKQVASVELHDGDSIEAGDTTIRVSLAGAADSVSKPVPAIEPAPAVPSTSPPQCVSDQTLVPRGWTAPRAGNRPTSNVAPSSPEVETVAPRHLREDAVRMKQAAIAATLVLATPPVPSVVSPNAVNHPEVRLFGKPDFSSGCVVPKGSPANKAKPDFSLEIASIPKVSLTADDRAKITAQSQPFTGYEIIEELGRGGMGVVYRARSTADGSLVALKVVLPAVASSPDDLTRFVREANIVKELSHPHIVPFRDLGHADGQLFFVMDLVPGVDGQALLRQSEGPLPVARAISIVCQLLEALSAAHRKGYVHRDVKPSNLLIETRPSEDFVWLADFGLARAYQASKLSGLTTTGNIGGTLPFMAPEQITHYRDVTPAADQYSAAATLYHLLTKRHTYDFPKEVAKRLLLILQEPPKPIQQHRADLPDTLAAIIHKGLARVPTERFVDVEAFRIALLSYLRLP